ncbi:regulatory protein, luxR family [Microbulbifer donghaiensis]|uniref:Regulatory protein, luxR family n=1 Tax=Microbulbifer donghaiensis TaxID=494016 RepID=A0A1M4XVG2_9GAMM|nr:helix-turn-helix transcriptional regulator [Microbulbifer donghaiensis]SHE97405.1 regulatory protein, luxR family [Microbulbifer donghaiensis]
MITGNNLTNWHQTIARIFESETDSESIYELLKGVEALVHGNSSMAILYPKKSTPQVTHHRLLANEKPSAQVDRYIDGAYLLDPFFRAAIDESSEGLFLLREVAPDAFEQTEYFRVYYSGANLSDEACYLVQGEDGTVASLSIGRAADLHGGRFSTDEVTLLRSLFPLVKSVLRKWILDRDSAETETFGNRLDSALENFGNSVLTKRECEVLHMTMQGHSIKSMAERLDASVDTIKTHRKHIYSKLDITSQSELFYLFISALRHHSESDKDPLVSLDQAS